MYSNLIYTATQIFMTAISLITAFGVFLHDGRVDKASLSVINPGYSGKYSSQTSSAVRLREYTNADSHTHPDHSSARNSLLSSFTYQSPSIAPQESRKRHTLTIQSNTRHAFDDTNLPLLSL